ncbi:MAG TPA: hypothetical protein VE978_27650 [Chitinophagales bacterium]|nr:hypothetical protein [Chitinophagales bacterium]
MKRILAFSLLLSLFLCSCKKEVLQKVIYDNTIYGVTPVNLYLSNADKTKQKSSDQFVSILYSNLTNQTIPADDLNHISEVTYSLGDKGLVNTMLLENFLNAPQIEIPSMQEMRSDISTFVSNTYLKFYLRKPSEYEKYFFTSMIEDDTAITPEMVYAAFAQSNEYLFY